MNGDTYRHDEIAEARLRFVGAQGPAHSVRLKSTGTRRKELWVCADSQEDFSPFSVHLSPEEGAYREP